MKIMTSLGILENISVVFVHTMKFNSVQWRSLIFVRRKKVIQVWNDIGVS